MPFFPELTQCSNGRVPEPDSTMKGKLPAYSWRLLSFASAYKTTGDPKYLKLMEEDFSHIKSEANEIFQLDIEHRASESFRFMTLQEVIPCIEVITKRSLREPSLEAYRTAEISKFLLPAYDGNTAAVGICARDGGFISARADTGKYSTESNIKSVADIGWISYIFSLLPEERFILMGS